MFLRARIFSLTVLYLFYVSGEKAIYVLGDISGVHLPPIWKTMIVWLDHFPYEFVVKII